jgi:hypothetical protein
MAKQNKTKQKKFYVQYNVGTVKYLVSFYDGKSTHKDGSNFYNIKSFKNKVLLKKFTDSLLKDGYIESSYI